MVLMRVSGLLEDAGKVKGESKTAWSEIGVPREMVLGNSKGATNLHVDAVVQHPLTDGGVKNQYMGNAWTVL